MLAAKVGNVGRHNEKRAGEEEEQGEACSQKEHQFRDNFGC